MYLLHFETRVILLTLLLIGGINNLSFPQKPYFKKFNENDGLPSSMVYHVFQDSQGYMWFATDAGVSRYNWSKFLNYTTDDGLADNEVFKIFEDTRHRIWFLSFNGKISYWYNGFFYNSKNTAFLRGIDSSSYFTNIIESKNGTIWIGTERNGVIKLDNKNQVRRLWNDNTPWNSISYLFETSNGKILATNYYGVADVLRKEVIYSDSIIRLEGIPDSRHLKIANDKLLFNNGNKFYLFDHTNKKSVKLAVKSAPGKVLNICKGKAKNVWICSRNGAYQIFGNNHTVYLPDVPVTTVYEDHEGNTWFTSLGKGVYVSPSLNILSYTTDEGLPVNESIILNTDKNNNLWVGHEKGWISRISTNSITPFNFLGKESTQDRGRITSICERNKTIWVASDFGLAKIENNVPKMGFGSTGEKCIISFKNKLMIGAVLGFAIYSEDTLNEFIRTVKKRVPSSSPNQEIVQFNKKRTVLTGRINKLYSDSRGRIWIALNNGVKLLEKDSIVDVHNSYPVLKCRVSDIKEAKDGTIWFSTFERGVVAIRDKRVFNLKEKDGLCSNICNSILVGSDNSIWIGTNKGIDKILNWGKSLSIDHWDFNDGLLSNQINSICEKDNKIWCATPKGISGLSETITKKKTAPIIHINAFYVMDNREKIKNGETKTLEYYRNRIKIKYEGLSYKYSSALTYRYKFNRKDDKWYYTTNSSVEFPSLSPGQYEFRVQAKTPDGLWSKRAAIVKFNIEKPFWQTYFFYTVSGILFTGGVWFVFYLRFKQLKRKELLLRNLTEAKLKALRAQMDPHFIFNSLTTLHNLVKNKTGSADRYILMFAKLMRLVLDNSRTDYISLSDEVLTLENYLELQKLRRLESFDYEITIDPKINPDSVFIPPMLAQPLIENSIEHGIFSTNKKGIINIKFEIIDKIMQLVIEDNGIGLEKSMELKQHFKKLHKSIATSIIKERLELLKKKKEDKVGLEISEIKDLDGKACGTLVRITFPYSLNY